MSILVNSATKVITQKIKWRGVTHYDPWIVPAALDMLVRTREKYPLTKVVSHSFPLAEVNEVAEMIAEDLELDMARRLHVLFEVHVADAEGRLGLALHRLERVRQFARSANDAPAATD